MVGLVYLKRNNDIGKTSIEVTVGGNLMIWVKIFIGNVMSAIYGYYVNKLAKLNDRSVICLKTKNYEKFYQLDDKFIKTKHKADIWHNRVDKLIYGIKKLN